MVLPEVHALAQRLLAAIDDDSPAYVELARALDASGGLLAWLEAEPALGRTLMVELRKLRPTTLWVRDGTALALGAKRLLQLDGALCSDTPADTLPEAEGRECWLEVRAPEAAGALDVLPRGWGLVIAGPLAGTSLPALRKRAPLRALGLLCEGDDGPLRLDVGARLDLLVQSAKAPRSELGARVLSFGSTPETYDLAGGALSSGLVCDAQRAPSWVLRLATKRRVPGPP